MGMVVKRFDVFLINLDPTSGAEMKKTRPGIVISPDEMNRYIATVIIAPMTTKGTAYPTRVACKFQGKQGQVVLDQIRTVDKTRLAKKLGRIDTKTQSDVLRSVRGDVFPINYSQSFPKHSPSPRAGHRPLRASVISARIARAISSGVIAPMSSPIGEWTRRRCSAPTPSRRRCSRIVVARRRLPIIPM